MPHATSETSHSLLLPLLSPHVTPLSTFPTDNSCIGGDHMNTDEYVHLPLHDDLGLSMQFKNASETITEDTIGATTSGHGQVVANDHHPQR